MSKARAQKIKLILFDVDGVMTDGTIFLFPAADQRLTPTGRRTPRGWGVRVQRARLPDLFDPMGSNDHCEQFDHRDSNHQHRDRYRVVIEPMPL